MTKLRQQLIDGLGEDDMQRWKAFSKTVQRVSPEHTFALRCVQYERIMRGDSISQIAHDSFCTPSRLSAYFKNIIRRSQEYDQMRG